MDLKTAAAIAANVLGLAIINYCNWRFFYKNDAMPGETKRELRNRFWKDTLQSVLRMGFPRPLR